MTRCYKSVGNKSVHLGFLLMLPKGLIVPNVIFKESMQKNFETAFCNRHHDQYNNMPLQGTGVARIYCSSVTDLLLKSHRRGNLQTEV